MIDNPLTPIPGSPVEPEFRPDPLPAKELKAVQPESYSIQRLGPSTVYVAKSQASPNFKSGVSGWRLDSNGEVITKNPVPASASAYGKAGMISWDASYIYVCTAANTWKRVAISTW